jgi:hypothetical protein
MHFGLNRPLTIVWLLGSVLAACSSETPIPDGTGGTSSGGSAGTPPTGGTTSTGGSATGGSSGSATGGSATGGSATGGSATGGSATGGSATGGGAGSGGAGSGGAGSGGGSATGGGGSGAGGSAGSGGGSPGGSGGASGSSGSGPGGSGGGGGATGKTAVANIMGVNGQTVSGTATFTQGTSMTTLVLNLSACPAGAHGVHLHAVKDCGNNGEAAGGHWVPNGEGLPDFTCTSTGAMLTFMKATSEWTVGDPAATDVTKYSLVVHEMGGASPGGRIGCGLINNTP